MTFRAARSDGHLVDRAGEVEALAAAADEAHAGRPRIVVVSGPGGIGKSVLVAEVMRRETGFRQVKITADETDALADYSALGQLSAAVRGVPRSFPLLATGPPADAAYLSVAAELVRLVGDLEPGRPVALLVEDAQWLDVSSSRALQLAVRRLGVEPALVVVTTRGGARPVDAGWNRLAATDGLGTALPLRPLTPAGLDRLAATVRGRALGPAAARRLHEHTGGHPLHARLVLEQVDWATLVSVTGAYPVPPSVADMVLARLNGLSDPARTLVVAVAVLGGAPSLSVAAALGGVADAAGPLEEALAAGLLTEVAGPGGRALAVPHPLVADAVLDGIGPARRAAAHRAALPFTTGDAWLRHRVAAADQPDEELAARLEAAADEHDAAGRVEAAAAGYLSAADVTPDAEAAQHRFLRGVVLVLTAGDFVRALSLAPRVRACPPGTERDMVLAVMAFAAGRMAEAQDMIEVALDQRGHRPEVGREAAMIDLAAAAAKTAIGLGGHREAAAVVANPASPPPWRRHAKLLGAMSYGGFGRTEEGLAVLAELPRAPTRVEGDDLPLLAARGGLYYWAGREDEALVDLRCLRHRVDRGESVRLFLGFALGMLAEVELAVGDWDAALSGAELALSVADAEGRPAAHTPAHAVAAQVNAERGAFEEADRHVRLCRQWVDAMPSPANRVVAAISEAVLARSAGRPAEMLDAVQPVADDDLPFRRAYWQVLHAQALLDTGRVSEARRRAETLAGRPGRAGVEAGLVIAEAALAELDLAAARRTAARLVDAVPPNRPFLVARTALTQGTVALAAGQVPAAVTALRRASAGFHDLGAQPWALRCERTLARAGDSAAVAERMHGRLTRREREVAQLAASGLSNAQAAARLYVSRKAVEFHLTNIYNKLGITSRRELSARLEATRTTPPPRPGAPSSGVRP